MSLIEDVLNRLEKLKVFTTFDLKNGFFHVKSRKYIAFVTHEGEYEFLKRLFCLCPSRNHFQTYVNTLSKEFLLDGTVVVYMVDFAITSQSEERGLEKWKRVLKIGADYGQDLNFKKCKLLMREQ